MAQPIIDFVITAHAAHQMARRGVSPDIVKAVLAAPQQRLPVRAGREVLQAQVSIAGQTYLVRVFVDVDRAPAEVVTVYRTSKIAKYGGSDHESAV